MKCIGTTGRNRAAGCINRSGRITKNDDTRSAVAAVVVVSVIASATTTAAEIRGSRRSNRINVGVSTTTRATRADIRISDLTTTATTRVSDRRSRHRRSFTRTTGAASRRCRS